MPKSFQINIEQPVLDDLRQRLAATRWPDQVAEADWSYGTNLAYLQDLCTYWEKNFDWRKQEDFLNSFNHFTTEMEELTIHFLHHKGQSDKRIPLLLTHGWPDSFVRFLKIIPLLTAADENGFSFDVVVPSIPGYGFSDKATKPGMNPEKIASIFHTLMVEKLGYPKFVAHGGDWGSTITEQLAVHHAGSLIAIHLTDIPFQHIFTAKPEDLTPAEKAYLAKGKAWQMTEGGYAMIQSTKPQKLAYGINDSPAGLAGWIVEPFRTWSDCNGDVESRFSKDELLTNLTIYWATQTANSSFRLYYEAMANKPKPGSKVEVSTGVCIFPKDIIPAPKVFAERFFNVQHWTEASKGGHFAAMEEPEKLAADIRTFVTNLSAT